MALDTRELAQALQRAVDAGAAAGGAVVTGWALVWEGQSIDDAQQDVYSNGVLIADGQSPATTLGLIAIGQATAVSHRPFDG